MRRATWMFVAVSLFPAAQLSARTPSFQGLGDLPGGSYRSKAVGVSGDGRVVVGRSSMADGPRAIKWTEQDGMTPLGPLPDGTPTLAANGASYDGSVIVGADYNGQAGAFRWTEPAGAVSLGSYGREGSLGAWDCSADGGLIVGGFGGSTDWHAWIWMPGGGFRKVDYGSDTVITGVSADGRWIAGWREASVTQPYQAFRRLLWDPPEFITSTEPGNDLTFGGLSADGTTFVGVDQGTHFGALGIRWTAEDGTVRLGDLPGGTLRSVAKDVSGDGEVIVGYSSTDVGLEAFIWDASGGMRNLRQVLVDEYGLDLNGWVLTSANAVSDDGMVIVGHGFNPDGDEGWVVVIPEPATLALVGVGAMGLLRRTSRRGRRGGRHTHAQARGLGG